jgi:hypothetical protein
MSGLTVEVVALEVAKAFEPLADRLADGEVDLLFSELGLPAPDVVLAASGVVTAIGNTVTELTELPPKVVALADALDAQDVAQIVAAAKEMFPTIQGVIATIEKIAEAVDAAATGAASGEIQVFAAELPDRLVGYVLATYLDREQPVIHGVASLLGIIETTAVAATAAAPAHTRRRIRFDLLDELFDDPLDAMATTYRWRQATFDFELLFARLLRFANRVSAFAFMQPGQAGGPPILRIGMVDIGRTDDPIPGLRAALRVDLAEKQDVTIPLGPGIGLEIGLEGAIEGGAAIDVIPPGELRIDPPTTEVSGAARIGLAVTNPAGGNLSLLSMAGTSGLFAAKLRASVGAEVGWDLTDGAATGELLIEVAVEDGRVVIDLSGADGFLSAILPDGGITVPFDILAGWSSERGVYFEGGAGIAIDIPIDVELGPIKLQMLHLELALGTAGLALEASGAVSAMLGPFAMAVERMGAKALLSFPDEGGNLGPANLGFDFKPPSGIGLSLDAGVVKGGGFLYIDEPKGEYAGILELSFGPVSIKAIGILTTKLPGGADGWALLLLVFGEFTPIQLGFGFNLSGVGGIIGLQHGVSIQALQDGLRTGVLDSVLFPRDPVANAPTLLAQLRLVFPIVPRALTVGPAVKLGWSTPALVTLKLGIILQFDDVLGSGPGSPSFSRVVLIGQLKVQIPPVDELGVDSPALIHLQVDVIGAYDANEQALSIDAVLRDSHVAMIPIVGSLVVRARFGANPTFMLAVGGFHPRFTDLPPGIPEQQRVGIQLDYDIVTVRIVGYVAITSNSFQTGAEASLVAAGGGFRVEAFLGFDALFIFEPVFHFEIDFRVGAAVKYKSISLASLTVKGMVSGPGRWEVEGHASISLLFFSVGIDFEVAWGDISTPALPSVAVGPLIREALSAPESWHTELPTGDALVTLRTVDVSGDVVAHPLGSLVGVQKIVPLGLDIDRVGRSVPSDGRRFDITKVTIGGAQVQNPTFRDEHFARAEYVDVSEEDKLSKPSFERFTAGVAVSTDAFGVPASQIAFEPEWETADLGKPRDPAQPNLFFLVRASSLVLHARLGAVALSPINASRRLTGEVTKVTVSPAGFGVAAERRPGEAVAGGTLTYTAAEQLSAATTGSTFVVDVAELAVLP